MDENNLHIGLFKSYLFLSQKGNLPIVRSVSQLKPYIKRLISSCNSVNIKRLGEYVKMSVTTGPSDRETFICFVGTKYHKRLQAPHLRGSYQPKFNSCQNCWPRILRTYKESTRKGHFVVLGQVVGSQGGDTGTVNWIKFRCKKKTGTI